ncbi:acyltransferase family protein [Krasilnikovia sp. M28-CT-15]|uniref:acyltransferase family protein n=1 Tax=Krasilnikovia sp. M28-CT-15 TaxID=3373540 RepID=UPI00399D4685
MRHTSGTTLPSLTGLRWVAAFLVFGYHLRVIEYFAPGLGADLVSAVFRSGSVGVSFFFILSGFVLMWASPWTAYRRFWWRRFARVYPLHVATALAVLVFLLVCARDDLPSGPALAANVGLVHAWVHDVAYYQSLNTVSWTLSCEAFFYLIFPLLAAGLSRLRIGGSVATAFGAWAVCLIGPAAGRLLFEPDSVGWFFHWTPVGRLPEFVCGIALACVVRQARFPQPQHFTRFWYLAAGLTVGGYLLSAHVPVPYNVAACTMPGFGLLLVAAAMSDLQTHWTPWRHAVMVRLGELSFAFYLVHILVIRVLEVVIGYHPHLVDARAAGLAMLAFLLSLGAAWLLHVGVERPFHRRLLCRRDGSARTPRQAGRSRAVGGDFGADGDCRTGADLASSSALRAGAR